MSTGPSSSVGLRSAIAAITWSRLRRGVVTGRASYPAARRDASEISA
jgi:hypothetical protein